MVILSFDAGATRRRLLVPALAAVLVLAPLATVPAAAQEPPAVAPVAGDVTAPGDPVQGAPEPSEPVDAVIVPGVPTLVGEARVGETLSIVSDPWGPEGVEVTVSWYADGVLLDGAVSSELVVSPTLVGARVHAELVGSVPGAEPVTRATAETDPVVEGTITGPDPVVDGTVAVGSTVVALVGWGEGVTTTYRWLRDGSPVDGALGAAYTLLPGDEGRELVVEVTGTRVGYATRTSSSTPVVVAAGTLVPQVPTVVGTARVGATLAASPGTWSPAATLAYQWHRGATAIAGATSSSYVLTPADLGHQVAVVVTGTAPGYAPREVASAPTAKVTAGVLTAPTPVVSGTARVGSRLAAAAGTWTAGTRLAYQWSVGGAKVAGATGATFTPRVADRGKVVTVTVTGTNAGYTTRAVTSKATGKVADGVLTPGAVKISGTARVGSVLKASAGTWSPKPTLSYQWKRNGAAIKGATKTSYTLTTADHGKRITVTVTGRATGYVARSATSAATAGVVRAFVRTAAPVVVGTAQVTRTLTARPGSWSPAASFSYQWKRNGVAIAGATRSTYKLTAADQGRRITVTVTGKRAAWVTASRTSAATAAVKAAPRPSRTAPVSTWNCPSWAPVKGNRNSMIYHVPGGRYYAKTKPEECFTTAAAARAAGYRASKNG
ncbi:hypothetical protein [Cellulosimicrobium cellulans]|uniref:sunset domain-containing protein n=1 Tax=Cellulosimicrobium cellulans TaxID=1710 RepID=UPI001BA6B8BA|nr:hypothetical protein [Cellulosimicrobium cellulans]QUC00041.1 hypothetical protein J5A69_01735 [Cellulosimicrobium cellulans]